jgi:hypothetical protein
VAAGVLLVLAVVFVFENTEEAEIRFVLPKVQMPLWVALAVTTVIGMVVGFLVARSRDANAERGWSPRLRCLAWDRRLEEGAKREQKGSKGRLTATKRSRR